MKPAYEFFRRRIATVLLVYNKKETGRYPYRFLSCVFIQVIQFGYYPAKGCVEKPTSGGAIKRNVIAHLIVFESSVST